MKKVIISSIVAVMVCTFSVFIIACNNLNKDIYDRAQELSNRSLSDYGGVGLRKSNNLTLTMDIYEYEIRYKEEGNNIPLSLKDSCEVYFLGLLSYLKETGRYNIIEERFADDFESMYCSLPDTDGDEIPDVVDTDDDSDRVSDALDDDDDNDGCLDWDEADGNVGGDTGYIGQGMFSGGGVRFATGSGRGTVIGEYVKRVEIDHSNEPGSKRDIDGDGITDYYDSDDDNDTIPDSIDDDDDNDGCMDWDELDGNAGGDTGSKPGKGQGKYNCGGQRHATGLGRGIDVGIPVEKRVCIGRNGEDDPLKGVDTSIYDNGE